jgi:hypothetical protein
MFSLMGTVFSAVNAVQINNLQKQSEITSKLATLVRFKKTILNILKLKIWHKMNF